MALVALEQNNTLVLFEILEAYDALLDVVPDLWVHVAVQPPGELINCLEVLLVRLLLLSQSRLRDLSPQVSGLPSFT